MTGLYHQRVRPLDDTRTLNADIETIINKSEHVKKTKKERGESLTPKEKKELTQEEKEYKSLRKTIQEKLIKFATRIPVFMYLTDYREYCLRDVISQLEPELFRKVTGLTLKDFELLVSLNVFNSELMNDAVYKFKRYEDASLEYTGIDRHTGQLIGLWDTVIAGEDARDEEKKFDSDEASAAIDEEPVAAKPWEAMTVGAEVSHKSLGVGKVKGIDEQFIYVAFHDRDRKFYYPKIFEDGYLTV